MSTLSLWPETADSVLPLRTANALPNVADDEQRIALAGIAELEQALHSRFGDRLIPDATLTRPLVSFQANKSKAGYRWYKFKEAFSAPLIEHLLQHYGVNAGKILDPFAGSGTALFVASACGLQAEGIEVLPIGQRLIAARQLLEAGLTEAEIATLRCWATGSNWQQVNANVSLPELRITRGAYPAETKAGIEKYLTALCAESERIQLLLVFALLCVLESVSYTRKDGQYLRWDYRSGRPQRSKIFDKGEIAEFNSAIRAKLQEIIADLEDFAQPAELFPNVRRQAEIQLHPDSCLAVLPAIASRSFEAVITSPPYCNRYDYTRTYALELALLGISEQELIHLRQQMLSCTVENRAKDLLAINANWKNALTAAEEQPLLQAILRYLEQQKTQGKLNNTGIPRMVRGYFYEMACVIAECARVLKPGAPLFMVNDNVRYAGAAISVDLILSALAEDLGFRTEKILVLPNGKGNSSQQMGEHGREVLRKCVYVWRRA